MTEPTQCSRCQRFTMKGQSRAHVDVGLYRCPAMPVWQFHNPFTERNCATFVRVSAEDLPARIAFEQGDK